VDVVARDERTIVCDLNKGEYPPTDGVSVVSVLGVLEYVSDPGPFWRWLSAVRRRVILSYVDLNPAFPIAARRAMGWLNHFRRDEIVGFAAGHGFALTSEERVSSDNTLFAFDPVEI
jgi:hypothetical protein